MKIGMSTKKIIISIVVLCFCVALAIILCVIIFGKNKDIRNNNESLNSILKSTSAEIITLEDVVPFDWDKAYYFPPYTPVEDMTKTIGVESDELHESSYDDMVNLVFVKGTAIVASICQHKNSLGYDIEFDTPVSKGEYKVFSVTKKDGIIQFSLK